MTTEARYQSFRDFYPFYLTQHVNPVSRRLHVVGTGLALLFLGVGIVADARYLIAAPLAGYGFAWVGHYVFEKNKPATFKYPLWSLAGDFRLFFETVSGLRKF